MRLIIAFGRKRSLRAQEMELRIALAHLSVALNDKSDCTCFTCFIRRNIEAIELMTAKEKVAQTTTETIHGMEVLVNEEDKR